MCIFFSFKFQQIDTYGIFFPDAICPLMYLSVQKGLVAELQNCIYFPSSISESRHIFCISGVRTHFANSVTQKLQPVYTAKTSVELTCTTFSKWWHYFLFPYVICSLSSYEIEACHYRLNPCGANLYISGLLKNAHFFILSWNVITFCLRNSRLSKNGLKDVLQMCTIFGL